MSQVRVTIDPPRALPPRQQLIGLENELVGLLQAGAGNPLLPLATPHALLCRPATVAVSRQQLRVLLSCLTRELNQQPEQAEFHGSPEMDTPAWR
jgi:hypothetical protein